MGYYSDVALCIKKEDYEVLKERAATIEDINIIEAADSIRFDDIDNVVLISWNYIKWYNYFEEVILVEKFLEELESQNKPYTFVRLGEQFDDIEWLEGSNDEGCICNKIHVNKSFDFDI